MGERSASSNATSGGGGRPRSSAAWPITSSGGAGASSQDVVGGAGIGRGHRGHERAGDVLDVDAAEDLAGLDDAPRGARAQLPERPAAGAVDAGEAEDVERQIRHRAPLGLGGDARAAARGGGGEGRVLVHPVPAPVAVDAGGGEVAGPEEARRGGGDGAPTTRAAPDRRPRRGAPPSSGATEEMRCVAAAMSGPRSAPGQTRASRPSASSAAAFPAERVVPITRQPGRWGTSARAE